MLKRHRLQTEKESLTDITDEVERSVEDSGISEGLCVVFCPHTTAAVTINENADPDVRHDILLGLSKAFPQNAEFRHAEGNSTAHLKSACVGSSVSIPVENGRLTLGTWQAVYFCEFDGPRTRYYYVKVLEG